MRNNIEYGIRAYPIVGVGQGVGPIDDGHYCLLRVQLTFELGARAPLQQRRRDGDVVHVAAPHTQEMYLNKGCVGLCLHD